MELRLSNSAKKETPYDFILMDMYMPELTGTQATQAIRAMPHGSSYSIILLTGLDGMNDDEAKKQGFDCFVEKPLNKKKFEEIAGKYKK
mmetsp:Transcript_15535/g.16126  ORF Transcript_15535/g.16126 Transcript_15535/m.16126 type:complete len:89 (-) Transcript_15535:141-407(-)